MALRRYIGSFDVLHLATHGVFRTDNPSFSSIKLTDAWLTVRDLAEVARGIQLADQLGERRQEADNPHPGPSSLYSYEAVALPSAIRIVRIGG